MHQLMRGLAQSIPSTVLYEWGERGANQKNKGKAFCSESVMSFLKKRKSIPKRQLKI